ncbi:hypothetical protein DXD68_13090 [Parabacteroides sp. TM07-1AC]|jgi:hypothetical protein|nr:hypothetical protein DXD68_13090 [Parabacteroides sp. TM07-1AC]
MFFGPLPDVVAGMEALFPFYGKPYFFLQCRAVCPIRLIVRTSGQQIIGIPTKYGYPEILNHNQNIK